MGDMRKYSHSLLFAVFLWTKMFLATCAHVANFYPVARPEINTCGGGGGAGARRRVYRYGSTEMYSPIWANTHLCGLTCDS
jgi:hypothetical protein